MTTISKVSYPPEEYYSAEDELWDYFKEKRLLVDLIHGRGVGADMQEMYLSTLRRTLDESMTDG